MTQADFTIANQTFPNTRAEINTSIQALATNSAGNSAPSTTFANQWWFDSDDNKLYMRNKDNDAWVEILTIGATSDKVETLSATSIGASGTATSVAGIPFYRNDTSSIYTHDVSGTDSTAVLNTAYGITALDAITTGDNNTALGSGAGSALNTGHRNTLIGQGAGSLLTEATHTVAIGNAAASGYDTETNNLAIGHVALGGSVAGGEYNVAIGNFSLDALTSGDNHTCVGYNAGTAMTTGTNSVCVGFEAGKTMQTAQNVTVVGYKAGTVNTIHELTAFGAEAALGNTSGAGITALGREAYKQGDTEGHNLAVGAQAMAGAVNGGEYNVAVGNFSLDALTSGDNNVGVGYQALTDVNSGGDNSTVGYNSLPNVTSGTDNVGLGRDAGASIINGSANICIGSGSDVSSSSQDFGIIIGFQIATVADRVAIGKSGALIYADFASSATWTQSSDERLKDNITSTDLGLDFINELRPVTFKWKDTTTVSEELTKHRTETNAKDTETLQYGLIAQEVKSAMDKVGHDKFTGWDLDEDESQSLREGQFIYPLIKAVQELSAEINKLKGE